MKQGHRVENVTFSIFPQPNQTFQVLWIGQTAGKQDELLLISEVMNASKFSEYGKQFRMLADRIDAMLAGIVPSDDQPAVSEYIKERVGEHNL